MPFKSKAQMRACYAQHKKGWNCAEWSHATSNIKSLPEHVKKSKVKKKESGGVLINPYRPPTQERVVKKAKKSAKPSFKEFMKKDKKEDVKEYKALTKKKK